MGLGLVQGQSECRRPVEDSCPCSGEHGIVLACIYVAKWGWLIHHFTEPQSVVGMCDADFFHPTEEKLITWLLGEEPNTKKTFQNHKHALHDNYETMQKQMFCTAACLIKET